VFHATEDRAYERVLELVLEHFLAHDAATSQGTVAVGPFLTAYVGIEEVPSSLRERLAPLDEGIHEFGESFTDPEDYHVAVAALPNRSERLYMVYDVSRVESPEMLKALGFVAAFVVGTLLVTALGAALGGSLSRAVVRPVVELAEVVGSGDPEDLPRRIDEGAYEAEVGVLARALKSAMVRIHAFVERERQFTRNASHELRTPVTVIKGASELMAAQPAAADPGIRRPLERIQRAVAAMEQTIEVFLLLAREEAGQGQPTRCNVRVVVDQVVQQRRSLIDGKSLAVEVDVAAEATVTAPEPVLAIVVDNLVANAFLRTPSGKVTIAFAADRLVVSDTGPGIPPEILETATQPHVKGSGSRGHGLGLAIVRTLCERFGWRLELASPKGQGTRAVLDFEPSRM